jgi:hypothetical protein
MRCPVAPVAADVHSSLACVTVLLALLDTAGAQAVYEAWRFYNNTGNFISSSAGPSEILVRH